MPLDLPPLRTPVIADLVPSLEDEHEAVLAWLWTEYAWRVKRDASDPSWRLTRLLAYRTVLVRQAIADSVSQVSLEHAGGAMLDHLGVTYYQLPRNAGESDDAYRDRIAAAPSLAAVGLTGPWYESQARAVDGVSSALVVGAARPDEAAGTTPGSVAVAIRATGMEEDFIDAVPGAALLEAVATKLTALDVRQQTDQVHVVPAFRVPYDVTVTLQLRANVDAAEARSAAEEGLRGVCRTTDEIGGQTSAALIAGGVISPAVALSASVSLQEVEHARAEATVGAGAAELAVTAVALGDPGEMITVALVDPGAADEALAITVAGMAITVSLATAADLDPHDHRRGPALRVADEPGPPPSAADVDRRDPGAGRRGPRQPDDPGRPRERGALVPQRHGGDLVTRPPTTASELERRLDAAAEARLDVPADLAGSVWDPARCPVEWLPRLAQVFQVPVFSVDWDVADPRRVIEESLVGRRLGGTVAGIEAILEAGGAVYDYTEGPAPFTATVDIRNAGATTLPTSQIAAILQRQKRASVKLTVNQLAGLDLQIPVRTGLGAAVVAAGLEGGL